MYCHQRQCFGKFYSRVQICIYSSVSFVLSRRYALILQQNFTICTYEPAEDTFVSKYIVSEGYWENEVAFWLGAIIHRMNPSVLYLELGANLGIHGIHAAMLNCTVWAVEPQEKNIHHARFFEFVIFTCQ